MLAQSQENLIINCSVVGKVECCVSLFQSFTYWSFGLVGEAKLYMALAFVGSPALGAAFGEAFAVLYSTVKDVITKTIAFKSILQQLKSTLDVLDPLVKDIQQSNRELGRSEKETHDLIQQMNKGVKLVSKYSNLKGWKHFVRYHYANKLCSLDEALHRFFQIHIPAWGLRNGIEVLRGELKMELLKEEVLMLVLTAPGGCGKTTLVKMLCQDEDIKGKYEIFFVMVTKTPNLKDIIRRIFCHKGDRVPEFQSDEEQLTRQNPILLILDDVWSGSESLLEKFKFHMTGYKILVTSRTAFPRFSCKYKLEPLSDEDATKLFRHLAILQDGNSYIPDDDTVKKIVKFCGGVIGSSLRGESAATWENRMQNWTSGDSILDSVPEDDLLKRLQSSLEFSDKKVKPKHEIIMKECFMDIGSFPEDQRICVASLVDMWEELYELDEVGTIANLLEISSQNLASLVVTRRDASEVGRYYAEDFVLQHDLLRELAIHQCRQEPIEKRKNLILDISGNNLPKWWTEQKQQHISSHLLSISSDENFSSSWCKIEPPEVKVLVLNFQTENYTLPEFVEKMEELKVLIATNYGSFPVGLGNFQLLGSVPNLKRIRLEKVSIPSICRTLSASRSLEKISLFMCHIGHAFRNCSVQISDALPNLREINIDYCIDLVELPAGMFDTISLKKLSITNCHKLSKLPEGLGKLRNLEVLRLRSCTELLELPESTGSLHNLVVLDISDCLSISKLPKHIGELCNLKEFHMKGCLALRNQWQLLPSILDLEHLKLVVCDEEMAKRWESIMEFRTHYSCPHIKVAEKYYSLKWLGNRF
ncbi:hypothetical protein I3842_01G025200 [Carya illinoinensis]|uniref:RPW8 domain-containing protein n=1 Tax=Carya illinoinensis TaxID=32201 RepID=A0A922G0T3_CARIL|nr:hypothetical protein I3842_01G025200 [Carya illinoinensis]